MSKKDYRYDKPYHKSGPLIRRILGYFKDHLARVVMGMLAMLAVSGATAYVAYLVKPAMDEIFVAKNMDALATIPFLFLGTMLLKNAGQFLQNYLLRSAGLRVLETMRNDLYGKMIYLPLGFFDDHQVGMLMTRIISDVQQVRQSLPAAVMLIRQIFTMVGLIGVVFYMDWYLAIWAVLVLPLALLPVFYFSKKLRKLSRKNQSKVADIASFLQESFSGVRVVKAFANEDEERGRFGKENSRLVKIALGQLVHSELSSRAMDLIGALGMVFVIWYGGKQVIAGVATPGTFFSFMTALIMLYDPVKKLNNANIQIQRAMAGAERVFEILDSVDITMEQDGHHKLSRAFTELRFEDAVFHYPGCERPALDHVNLTVRQGERVAIVGPSGAGKTTLVNCIPRFQDLTSGSLRLNGRDIRDYTLASLRRSMGLVSQDAFLFNVSIRENIAYGHQAMAGEKTPVTAAELGPAVMRATRAAYAHEFVAALPNGYDTVIGERGVKLSGGQKQRLTIARAILKDPPLLILDEATSALDSESEQIVQKALENLMEGRTSIVIAHRLSTVLSADRIVVMEAGRVVDQGAHAELLERCPLYAKLYAMQFKEPEAPASPEQENPEPEGAAPQGAKAC